MSVSKGFTLIEMLMVVVMLAVLATLAGPSFTQLSAKNRVRNLGSDLHISLLKARSEAVKQNANITITPIGATWNTGWQIVDGGGNVLFQVDATRSTVTASSNNDIVYMGSGRTQGTAIRSFEIFDAKLTHARDKRCVSIGLTGMPGIKEGAC